MFSQYAFAQNILDKKVDTLPEVIVNAYNRQNTYINTSSTIAILNANVINRGGSELLVSEINALPGIQFDERSPGSYRLNLRGSSTRSPFGVRNVKVYYNGIPYTEPGGTTYLNQMSFAKYADAAFLKGPASSIYGVGTGGVVLLKDEPADHDNFSLSAGYGAYHSYSVSADGDFVAGITQTRASIYWDQSDGFRDQSASRRNLFTLHSNINFSKSAQLRLTLLHGNLNYQTPGGLTLREYETNGRQARPAAGGFPSAVDAKAAIDQQTSLAGLLFKTVMGNGFSQETSVYFAEAQLVNPAIRNYSDSKIPHWGVRSVWNWEKKVSQSIFTNVFAGLETQWGRNSAEVFDNNLGEKGKIQQSSKIATNPIFYFLQNDWDFGNGWAVQVSGAFHAMDIHIDNFVPTDTSVHFKYAGIFTPRVSVSKKIGKSWFMYANYSKGFSPATTDEIYPTGGTLNTNLQPEKGDNYELGIRRKLGANSLVELNGYYFRLSQTIVQRRDAGGGDFYLNAGSTTQPGLEALWTQYVPLSSQWYLQTQFSCNFQPYKYHRFMMNDGDYSGNEMPGVSRNKVASIVSLENRCLGNFFVLYQYMDKMYLDDTNVFSEQPYHLLNAGLRKSFSIGNRNRFDLGINAKNLLNVQYSMGDDINAAAGRFYNQAAKRNFTVRLTYHID